MNLQELKFSSIESKIQAVLFDADGLIKESDNTMFDLTAGTENIYEIVDLLLGMEDVIRGLSPKEELKFNCVDTVINGYHSQFDITISRYDDHFLLLLYDYAEQYQRVFELQQERNVRDISTNKLEREHKKIREENEIISRLYEQMSASGTSEYVLLKSDNILVNVDLNTVNYFEAYGDYIKVHTESKTYIIYNRMKHIEPQLPVNNFARIHRSYIIQINKIKNIEQMSVNVADKILPIGKQYKQELLDKMNML